MKIIIHAGMHKTGSSSIQDHFFSTPYPGLRYARWSEANHCGLFVLLFHEQEKLASYWGFSNRGTDFCARLPQMRQDWRAKLEEDLTLAKANNETLIISAEDISGPLFHEAVSRMAEFFHQWTDDITVLAYVRRPLSYALSAFQQLVKNGGIKALEAEKLWPFYKARFEILDTSFGRDNVILKPYDRDLLTGGDVVLDFAALVGAKVTTPPKSESNISLSAEATALLFTQRQLGAGFVSGFDNAYAANAAMISSLRSIGSSKLDFSDSLWGPVLEKNRADLDWIENRLGVSLRDSSAPDAIVISRKEDLFDLAVKYQPDLEVALLTALHSRHARALDETVVTLELLRRLAYAPYSSL